RRRADGTQHHPRRDRAARAGRRRQRRRHRRVDARGAVESQRRVRAEGAGRGARLRQPGGRCAGRARGGAADRRERRAGACRDRTAASRRRTVRGRGRLVHARARARAGSLRDPLFARDRVHAARQGRRRARAVRAVRRRAAGGAGETAERARDPMRFVALFAALLVAADTPPPQFVDVARQAGVVFHHANGASPEKHLIETMGSGAVFFDYDGDGFIDIFLVDGLSQHRLFHNKGNGTFEDVTDRSGIQRRVYGMGACAADYDGDGKQDLFITGYGGNALYHGRGDGTFTDVTAAAHVGEATWGAGCAWADLDGDGDLDLWVTQYVKADRSINPFCGDPAK